MRVHNTMYLHAVRIVTGEDEHSNASKSLIYYYIFLNKTMTCFLGLRLMASPPLPTVIPI